MPTRRTSRLITAASLVAAAALALTGCSGSTTSSSTPAASSASAISADRCATNKAAGKITYITGFQYQASASILDILAAKQLGYFDALCLDVEIQPGTGDTAGNAQLVAAGTATITDLGGDSDLLLAQANGVNVTAIATYGQVPITTLMTGTNITDLKQLEGTTLGQKGQIPPEIEAMLVKNGVDMSKIDSVVVGYDPTILPRGQVQSLTGYKSNEPLTLKAAGDAITEWNPEDYDIPGTFGTVVANPAFVTSNTTTTEDFLRAAFHAYDYCETNAQECVGYAAALAGGGASYDVDHNVQVWQTETGLVKDSLPAGTPLGSLNTDLMAKEISFLIDSTQLTSAPDVTAFTDPSLVSAIYNGADLIWPAP
ncbi:ABC transporter substrate-binding protein [Subtercola boreus]|uniref:Thiamine pyrimidine synthase n=1 Tax=Subtercola boreus TaxID=120213 RepID=A0A3E0W6W4_9MICO|nr:ABC transporter substrate-binding protein [Subtercola boreus]RFA17989.1 myristoyl transferase [Subtercola boreus]RFA18371.1 myristoyl transferase [Subtercola boreus]RFA24900.1 myristoyl transferase [Subtercola boreus]